MLNSVSLPHGIQYTFSDQAIVVQGPCWLQKLTCSKVPTRTFPPWFLKVTSTSFFVAEAPNLCTFELRDSAAFAEGLLGEPLPAVGEDIVLFIYIHQCKDQNFGCTVSEWADPSLVTHTKLQI